jgi:putative tryptophan/tyrosine transport system substrate-binding protein
MRRRELITLLGSAAATWPLMARAQQTERLRTVGILLGSTDNPEMRRLLGAFMESFKALGWTENRNVRFDAFVGAAPG